MGFEPVGLRPNGFQDRLVGRFDTSPYSILRKILYQSIKIVRVKYVEKETENKENNGKSFPEILIQEFRKL